MKRFKDILCVVEPEGICKPVLERAVTLAENNQASLTVVDVVEHVTDGISLPAGETISADLQAEMVKSHKQKLDALVEPYIKRIKLETRILVGTPFLEIIRDVLCNGRDLVIKLPEQQDWLDRLFGSDDMHVLRKCPCPVWLIKPQEPKSYRRILAAVDVEDTESPEEMESQRILNHQILAMASSLALAESAELHVVHVWDAIGESAMRHGVFMRTEEDTVNSYVENVRQQHETSLDNLIGEVEASVGKEVLDYIKYETHLVKGWARKEIPAQAKRINADLVVMGTVARTGIPGFIMGNTAETILNQIDCSVLAIKPPGFESPVTVDG